MSNNHDREAEMTGLGAADGLVIRLARADDAVAIARLAALDSQRPPTGALLLAEMAGELWAGLPLEGGPPLADPFRPTAQVVELLRVRAAQLREPSRSRPSVVRLPRLLVGLAARARA